MPSTDRGAKRRRVLVTGGTSGIGLAIANRFADGGDHVLATARSEERVSQFAALAAAEGRSIRYLPLELTSRESIDALVERVTRDGEGLDVLVNNAGAGILGAVEEVDEEEALRQFAVNLFGPLALTRRLLPALRQNRGHIVWIGSIAGRVALPFQAHYSATKAAVAAISDAMRLELAPHGVCVTCVEPGDFATGFTASRRVRSAPASLYATVMERCRAEVERQERTAPEPSVVGDIVWQVCGSKRPPARRPAGPGARTICALLGIVPRPIVERLVARRYDVGGI
ncbi:MAG: SDR family NAD(P)-dependent oxidoreductase [Vicinamibacterales bacterium]